MDVQNLLGGGSIETANLLTKWRRYGFRVVLLRNQAVIFLVKGNVNAHFMGTLRVTSLCVDFFCVLSCSAEASL